MKPFLGDNFLLENEVAEALYHDYAAKMPIIDYHCHLSPKDIAENRNFSNITDAWLEGDHYKWRAMRTLGVNESYITGDKAAEAKFKKWAEVVPYTLRNPLYHWTHLELQRYFGINELLRPKSANAIFNSSSAQLQSAVLSTQGILTKMNVKVVCTTDDPADSLEHHKKIADDQFSTQILPTFRPDKSYAFEDLEAYHGYINKLSHSAGKKINSLDTLLEVLYERIEYFHSMGGRLADHGLEYIPAAQKDALSPEKVFEKAYNKKELEKSEIDHLSNYILLQLSKKYHEKGWTQQFHLGALRNNNKRMFRNLGPDTGFDSIGDFPQARSLSQYLNELDNSDQLAKTIIYNLNPTDNEVIATMIGNFNDGSVKGKVQFGSGWWFLDQKDGMEKQMNALSNMGMLSCFVGMLTDSRSFLSFPRHEYFRRVLCNLVGKDVVSGELPNDISLLGKIIQDICYKNAKDYFNFKL
jgi:glucuronate isomerase